MGDARRISLMAEPIPERVRRGAKLLDDVAPGWADRINLATLRLCDSSQCILGQLYGEYYPAGAQAVFGATDLAGPNNEAEHGFDLYSEECYPVGRWEELQQAWLEEIRRRCVRSIDLLSVDIASGTSQQRCGQMDLFRQAI